MGGWGAEDRQPLRRNEASTSQKETSRRGHRRDIRQTAGSAPKMPGPCYYHAAPRWSHSGPKGQERKLFVHMALVGLCDTCHSPSMHVAPCPILHPQVSPVKLSDTRIERLRFMETACTGSRSCATVERTTIQENLLQSATFAGRRGGARTCNKFPSIADYADAQRLTT